MPRTLIGPRVTFSRIVLWAKRLKLWKTMPTSARSEARALPSCGSAVPSRVIVPSSMVSRRLIVRHRVDLPDPDGPITTTTSPRVTVRSMSLRACSCRSASARRTGRREAHPARPTLTPGALRLIGATYPHVIRSGYHHVARTGDRDRRRVPAAESMVLVRGVFRRVVPQRTRRGDGAYGPGVGVPAAQLGEPQGTGSGRSAARAATTSARGIRRPSVTWGSQPGC